MAATLSAMVKLCTKAPEFSLMDSVSDNIFTLEQLKGTKATVIMFICNHCPYVKHIYNHLAGFTPDYKYKGVSFIGINSNNYLAYPDDSPEKMKNLAIELGYQFPYLIDDSQKVAKDYNATCTPDFFLYDSELKLVYRGQYDNSRPNNGIPVTGDELKSALDAIISNSTVNPDQIPSLGCNIKWK
jgi:peroxiredoxin